MTTATEKPLRELALAYLAGGLSGAETCGKTPCE